MGFLLENPAFLDRYSGKDNLRLLAGIRGEISEEDICQVIRRVGLDPEDKKKYRKYSLGMKQRLGLAAAVMERPELVILDEPANALDESGVLMLREMMRKERERKVKMRHHKRLILNLLVLAVCAAAGRIYLLNRNTPKVNTVCYQTGEEVPVDSGSGSDSDLKMAGYTIRVQSAELVDAAEFCERYNVERKALQETSGAEQYYLVTAEFFNHNQEDDNSYGVGLLTVNLLADTTYSMLDSDAFLEANPAMDGVDFALRGQTGITLVLPYGIYELPDSQVSARQIREGKVGLLLTEYPQRKIIRLEDSPEGE